MHGAASIRSVLAIITPAAKEQAFCKATVKPLGMRELKEVSYVLNSLELHQFTPVEKLT